MKTLRQHINEWKLTDDSTVEIRKIKPDSYDELREIIIDRYNKNNETIDLTDVDVSNITSFGEIYNSHKYTGFIGCGLFYNLRNVEIINVTGWKTSKIESMEYMFDQCLHLREIKGIENLYISNVGDMSYMFRLCTSLNYLDLSKWKLKKTYNINHIFEECEKLREIKGIEYWDVSNIKEMYNAFFYCKTSPSWYDRNKWE